MKLVDNARECPTTYGLAASWVVVYALMVWHQGGFRGGELSIVGFGAIRNETTHMFGDLTYRDFARGEVWRVITATFIHFSLAHLVINLIGLIQLGWLMEAWYGARQFLAICLGVGAMGNLLGVLMRQGVANGRVWLQAHGLARVFPPAIMNGPAPEVVAQIPAAGGSTVILGLIGLALVVGWRSRTRVGAFLRDQMLGFLAFTAVIGFFGMQVIDNYGHAGGAISGACLGFLHRRLVRTPDRGGFRRFVAGGAFATLLLCVVATGIVARAETVKERRRDQIQKLEQEAMFAELLAQRLAALAGPAEQLAFDTQALAIRGALARGDSSAIAGLDLGVVVERLVAPGRAPIPRPQLLSAVRDRLADLAAIRPHLDAKLAGTELDTLERLGDTLLRDGLDSRRLFDFRLALVDLERRALRTRDEALVKVESRRGGIGRQ